MGLFLGTLIMSDDFWAFSEFTVYGVVACSRLETCGETAPRWFAVVLFRSPYTQNIEAEPYTFSWAPFTLWTSRDGQV